MQSGSEYLKKLFKRHTPINQSGQAMHTVKSAARAYAAYGIGGGLKTFRIGDYLNTEGKTELLNHSVRVSIKFGNH